MRSGEILHIRPTFLPDGRHYLFRATSQSNSGIWVGSLDSLDRKLVKEPTVGNMIYASGHVLYMNDSTLMAQSFDTERLEVTGVPIPVVEQVQTSGVLPPVGAVALSEAGVLAYRAGATPLGISSPGSTVAATCNTPSAHAATISISRCREMEHAFPSV